MTNMEPLTTEQLGARAEKLNAMNVEGHVTSFVTFTRILAEDLLRVAKNYTENGMTLNPETVRVRMENLLSRVALIEELREGRP